MDEIHEEVKAIEAIYCGKNEFVLHSEGASSVIFAVTTNPVNDPNLKITVLFTLSAPFYPNKPPALSVQCQDLNRSDCDAIRALLIEEAKSYCGSPMVLNLLTTLQEKDDLRKKDITSVAQALEDEEEPVTCVLQLDHMRNKSQYIKTIKRWCEELGIWGRLFFCHRWIIIILQGNAHNIKTYIQRNKQQCVDVDSSGHPCKERLLSILYHGCQEKLAFSNFEVVSLDPNDLRNYLTQHNLSKVYLNYIYSTFQ